MQEMIRDLLSDKDHAETLAGENRDLKEKLAAVQSELFTLKVTLTTSSDDAVLELADRRESAALW
jgi:hypothetical protein